MKSRYYYNKVKLPFYWAHFLAEKNSTVFHSNVLSVNSSFSIFCLLRLYHHHFFPEYWICAVVGSAAGANLSRVVAACETAAPRSAAARFIRQLKCVRRSHSIQLLSAQPQVASKNNQFIREPIHM